MASRLHGITASGTVRVAGVAGAIFLTALASVALVWWLDPALHGAFDPGLLWRNALPVFLVILLIYALSGRALPTWVFGGTLVWIVFNVNSIKERNLNAPLLPGDLVLWHQVLHNIGFFANYTGHRFVLVLTALVFMALLWATWRLERRWWHPHWMARLACVVLLSAAIVTLYRGDALWRAAYADEVLPGFEVWDPMASVANTGVMAGLVRMAQEAQTAIPKADQVLVSGFAARHTDEIKARMARQPPAELPDIVVVQSEAFFDPGVIKGVDFGSFVPNFERLAATGITGSLATPTYGGGTIRTEFETLTGYPIQAFPAILYPYYGMASEWMPSVPRRLAAFGYSATLFHPFRSSFWNRRQVMSELGFQHSYYLKSFAGVERAGAYVSDHALFDFVLAHLDDTRREAQYVLVITMENHGPWDSDPGLLANVLDGHPLPSGLSTTGTMEMTYYLSHLVNGDHALGDFAKRLLARPRWTVLLFYGDHLPALPAAFADLSFDDHGAAVQEHTRYMVVSNRPLVPRKLDLSSHELPALLFDTIGLPEDGYLALDSLVRQDRSRDHDLHGTDYRLMQFNAAQLEVACRHRLDAAGHCGGQRPPSSD
ncbi:LTA synthase family protein [Rhodanobacter glycinis]|uniref:LTA synthase family protein n=1 Tax=Rhodanobacter glycinis TaxID=582702 RepID=A0A502CES7_9GAMM|nr:LTA synthase family protein [Rhodanobacter glycinis]TPG11192.1 LTA synthase family protein [Rhodanobacter glycinis]